MERPATPDCQPEVPISKELIYEASFGWSPEQWSLTRMPQFKMFVEALMGFSHTHRPDGLIIHS